MGPIIERLTPAAGITLNSSTSSTYYAKIDGRQNYRVYAPWSAGSSVDISMQVLPTISTGSTRLSPAWPTTSGADTAMVFPDGGAHDPANAASGAAVVFVNVPVSEIAIAVTNGTATAATVHIFVEKI